MNDAVDLDEVFERNYDLLRIFARHIMTGQRPSHTLSETGLINEAGLKLLENHRSGGGVYESEAHFVNTWKWAMGKVLLDHERRRSSQKRGGGWVRCDLEFLQESIRRPDADTTALNDALDQLHERDRLQHELQCKRFFGRYACDEIAEELDLSESDVRRRLQRALQFLRHRLQ